MPAPRTIVTLIDEDGDEFPVTLQGVYPEIPPAADYAEALQIADGFKASGFFSPRGELKLGGIDYVGGQT